MDNFFEFLDTYVLPVVVLSAVAGMVIGFCYMINIYADLLA